MLSRPEFGGDMAVPETVSALRANLPRTVDPTLANTAALQYLAQIDPAKYAELTTKQTKLPGKIDEFVTAKQMKLIPENMSFQQFEEIGKKP